MLEHYLGLIEAREERRKGEKRKSFVKVGDDIPISTIVVDVIFESDSENSEDDEQTNADNNIPDSDDEYEDTAANTPFPSLVTSLFETITEEIDDETNLSYKSENDDPEIEDETVEKQEILIEDASSPISEKILIVIENHHHNMNNHSVEKEEIEEESLSTDVRKFTSESKVGVPEGKPQSTVNHTKGLNSVTKGPWNLTSFSVIIIIVIISIFLSQRFFSNSVVVSK